MSFILHFLTNSTIEKTVTELYSVNFSDQAITSTNNYKRRPKRVSFYIKHDRSAFIQDIISRNCSSYRNIANYGIRILQVGNPLSGERFNGVLLLTSVRYVKKTKRIYMTCYDRLKLFEVFNDAEKIRFFGGWQYPMPPTPITTIDLFDYMLDKFTEELPGIDVQINLPASTDIPEHLVEGLDLFEFSRDSYLDEEMDAMEDWSGNTIDTSFKKGFVRENLDAPGGDIVDYYRYYVDWFGMLYLDPADDLFHIVVYFKAWKIFNKLQWSGYHTWTYHITRDNITDAQYQYQRLNNWIVAAYQKILSGSPNVGDYDMNKDLFANMGFSDGAYCHYETSANGSDKQIKFTGNIFAPVQLWYGEEGEEYKYEYFNYSEPLEAPLNLLAAIKTLMSYYNYTFYCEIGDVVNVINKDGYYLLPDAIEIEDSHTIDVQYLQRDTNQPIPSVNSLTGEKEILEEQLKEYMSQFMANASYVSLKVKWLTLYEFLLLQRITLFGVNYRIEKIWRDKKLNRWQIEAGVL